MHLNWRIDVYNYGRVIGSTYLVLINFPFSNIYAFIPIYDSLLSYSNLFLLLLFIYFTLFFLISVILPPTQELIFSFKTYFFLNWSKYASSSNSNSSIFESYCSSKSSFLIFLIKSLFILYRSSFFLGISIRISGL